MNQKGTSAVEYALLLMGIAAVIVLAIGQFGNTITELYLRAAHLFQLTP
jgi:Flp pilus assembly pilin Flp